MVNKNKNKGIVVLFAFTLSLFLLIEIKIIPSLYDEYFAYSDGLNDVDSHSVIDIRDYHEKTLKNDTEINAMMSKLPLRDIPCSYVIDVENHKIIFNYQGRVEEIGFQRVKPDVAYNAVVLFGLIDDLQYIDVSFDNDNYSFKRVKIERVFGCNIYDLMFDVNRWNTTVRDRFIEEDDFVRKFYKKELINEI